ncbi:hypothetical protein K0M31_010172 [Melipona bicolor]|uniref:Uncharacterized protein n=1 Tax=Melipona bicolor TaxID=60889 RepID=A0AA40FNC8_9HYME|nr:hypothetical protein K0M31_010172 [Melipona bicolor]
MSRSEVAATAGELPWQTYTNGQECEGCVRRGIGLESLNPQKCHMDVVRDRLAEKVGFARKLVKWARNKSRWNRALLSYTCNNCN